MTINVDGKFLTPPEHAAEDHTGIAAAMSGAANAGGASGVQPTIRIIAGSNITVGFTEDIPGNELEFTITAASSFPGYYAGAMAANAGGGTAGTSPQVARGNHAHPAVTVPTMQTTVGQRNNINVSNLVVATGFTPKLAVINYNRVGFSSGVGQTRGTAAADQSYLNHSSGFMHLGIVGFAGGGANDWKCAQFDATQVVIQGLAGVTTVHMIVLGE